MPATGRAACSSGQSSRNPTRPSSSDPKQKREKIKSSQSYEQPPRRESAQNPTGFATKRPGLKSRAYSAPMVSKSHLDGPDNEHLGDTASGELADDEEIVGDPFFQRYNFPQADEAAGEDGSSSSPDGSSDTEGPLSPTHIKSRPSILAESLPSPRSPTLSITSQGNDTTTTMQDINIGVIGVHDAGKSSFIRRALNLQNTASPNIASRKMLIDGVSYVVRLLELSFSEVYIGEGNCIKWPDTIDDYATPRIDGAITIYDVMNLQSLERVPETLNALHQAHLPSVLVACKCDNHPVNREVDPSMVDQEAKSAHADINTFQTQDSSSESQKRCLSVILRLIISARRAQSQATTTRRRANSSAVRHVSPRETWTRRHERASSEFSGSRLKARTPGPYETDTGNAKSHRYNPSDTTGHTFLDLEESPGYESFDIEAQSSDQEQSVVSELPSDEKGYTFDQLVDRLLAQPLSKNDSKFVAIFLALYRRFAAPSQLLETIIRRFEGLSRDKDPQMIRTIAQLRHLAILQQWVSCYPGDFAYPKTRRTMRRFVSSLASNRIFSIAAREMLQDLEIVAEDDDTDWACCDKNRDNPEPVQTFHNVLDEDSEDDEFSKGIGHMSMGSDGQVISRSTTTNTSRSMLSTAVSSSSSSRAMLNAVEWAQRQASQLVPNPIRPLSKLQWHLVMAESEENIAKELTRMDWTMFSSIRPRDLVRHVSMNSEEKKRCKSLENVNRMIEHFNHVAYLVTNYILLRDKPKHRALMLEKFMKVARKLRELNNYNSLGAVLAGIKGTAVHRLVATRDLVPQAAARDFMKLEILMGTQKSHFAYRLAWENSSGERIPYLPLHRRDLVSAAEGNSTFVGDKDRKSVV